MGIAFENRTVHECAGVALVGVTAYILLICVLDKVSCKLPLLTCGESAAASATQTRIKNYLNYIIGCHCLEHLSECLITVSSDIFIDTFGIDYTAVSQCDSVLLFIEVGFLERLYLVFCDCFIVYKTCNDTSLEQMLRNDFRNIFFLNHRVECTLRINDHNRTERTQTETSCADYHNFVGKTVLVDFFL